MKCYGMSARYPASNTLGACPKRESCAHFVPWPADKSGDKLHACRDLEEHEAFVAAEPKPQQEMFS